MDPRRLKVKWTDTGHWLARCDHSTGVIELNRREYPKLSPLYQDYVWCHECVHLLCDVYDEDECNRIVDRLFVDRAKTERERRERLDFLLKSESGVTKSGLFGVDDAVLWGVDKALDIVGDIVVKEKMNQLAFEANEKSGFNALSEDDQKAAVEIMLDYAFKKARRSSTRTAQKFFMAKMEPLLTPLSISSYARLLSRYPWIAGYIDKYEKKYGFGFMEVKPADYKDIKTGVAIAVVILVVAIVLLYMYKIKK